jgi:hypothetical protein
MHRSQWRGGTRQLDPGVESTCATQTAVCGRHKRNQRYVTTWLQGQTKVWLLENKLEQGYHSLNEQQAAIRGIRRAALPSRIMEILLPNPQLTSSFVA